MDKVVNAYKNVRLETGFEFNGDIVAGTKTGLFCIETENGRIKSITPDDADAKAIDADGLLMLPAFKDMHTHLDKTLYGLPWKAVSGKKRSVKDMIALEQRIIPELLRTAVVRSEQLIELLQSFGIHYVRSHFNIDPTSGLRSLEHLQQALRNKKESFAAELVAFPQHGIFYTDTAALLKEAAQLEAVGFIGGLDPSTIDRSISKPLDFIIQLAADHDKGIDIHLHETGAAGIKTIEYLVDRVMEIPRLQGKTTVSHAFVLAHLPEKKLSALAEKLASAKISIATALPVRGGHIMPLPVLWKHGVEVLTGNDNIQDHWGTLGSGNLLQKANLAADLYGQETEYALSRLLGMATGNKLPLDNKGHLQWPQKGDPADFVLIDASCSAEAVSRISPVKQLVHQGNIVY